MPIYSKLDASGLIVNRVVSDVLPVESGFTFVQEADVAYEIGGSITSGVYAPRPPASPLAPVIPQSISDRQFFQQLAIAGIITQDQALAANAAVIPAPLLALIVAMPADQQFGAKMIVSGATVFQRSNPLTIAIGTAYGMTSDQIDAFFVAAASL